MTRNRSLTSAVNVLVALVAIKMTKKKQHEEKNIKAIITTSHRPNVHLRQIAKAFTWIFPYTTRINRGNMNLRELLRYSAKQKAERVVILQARQRSIGKISIYDISQIPWRPFWLDLSVSEFNLNYREFFQRYGRLNPVKVSLQITDVDPLLKRKIKLLFNPILELSNNVDQDILKEKLQKKNYLHSRSIVIKMETASKRHRSYYFQVVEPITNFVHKKKKIKCPEEDQLKKKFRR